MCALFSDDVPFHQLYKYHLLQKNALKVFLILIIQSDTMNHRCDLDVAQSKPANTKQVDKCPAHVLSMEMQNEPGEQNLPLFLSTTDTFMPVCKENVLGETFCYLNCEWQ